MKFQNTKSGKFYSTSVRKNLRNKFAFDLTFEAAVLYKSEDMNLLC